MKEWNNRGMYIENLVMKRFISISNSSGKNWVLPIENTSTAMEIYQPAAWRGKLIKLMLPKLIKYALIPIKYEIVQIESVIPAEIMNIIMERFPDDKLQVSYYGGTPGTHCKPTIQVFSGKQLLGYVKYAKDPNIAELFHNEEIILKRLHDCGIQNVPNCITNHVLSNRTAVFVQDTKKKHPSKTLHKFTQVHDLFLEQLYRMTKIRIMFQTTDFAQTLLDLRERATTLNVFEQKLIQKATDYIWKYFNNQGLVEFGACHRDFTPWNTCIVNGELFVFDWEYAKLTYPNGMDMARFFVELCRQEKHLNNQTILEKYKQRKHSLQILYCYLLDNIDIYLTRGQQSDQEIIASSLELLRLSMEDI